MYTLCTDARWSKILKNCMQDSPLCCWIKHFRKMRKMQVWNRLKHAISSIYKQFSLSLPHKYFTWQKQTFFSCWVFHIIARTCSGWVVWRLLLRRWSSLAEDHFSTHQEKAAMLLLWLDTTYLLHIFQTSTSMSAKNIFHPNIFFIFFFISNHHSTNALLILVFDVG